MQTLFLALAGCALLAWKWRRDQAETMRHRAQFFDDCGEVLEAAATRPGAMGYPVLEGRWRGLRVIAEPVVDALGVRKLPSLWLRVTVLAPVATSATFDLMMRPIGTEFFSPFDRLDHRLDTPAGWPERAVLRSDDPDGCPRLEAIAPHVDLFEQPQAKELLITPRGVRLVWQADEAERSDFLLLRQAHFRKARLDPAVLADLVVRCVAIRQALEPVAMRQPARVRA